MSARKPKGVSIAVPSQEPSYVLTRNGTFKKGAFVIRKKGMVAEEGEIKGLGEVMSLEILDEDVGSGACSTVKRARDNEHNRVVALKVVNVLEQDRRHQLMNELATLTQGTSPHIVSFYGAFSQEGMIYIALEFMEGGSLDDATAKMGKIPEPLIGCIAPQILQGLNFLHNECRRIHRDIKPSNILLTKTGQAKISDFGISRFVANDDKCVTFVGTTNYMSPERLDGTSYGFASDIWSLGLTFLECLKGSFPYPSAKGYFEMLNHIVHEPIPNIGDFSSECSDFLDKCLKKKASDRATAKDLLKHPFAIAHAKKTKEMEKWTAEMMKVQKRNAPPTPSKSKRGSGSSKN